MGITLWAGNTNREIYSVWWAFDRIKSLPDGVGQQTQFWFKILAVLEAHLVGIKTMSHINQVLQGFHYLGHVLVYCLHASRKSIDQGVSGNTGYAAA